MIEIVRCCKCNQTVRLPESQSLWVRCPHCGADYPFSDILAKLPPALESIDPPAQPETAMAPGSQGASAVEDQARKQPVTKLNAHPDLNRVEAGGQTPAVHVRSPGQTRADKRKPGSPLVPGGGIKVVLGGMGGLLLGQLVLWWLPAPYRTDPLNLAVKLPHAVAFLAPASLRAEPLLGDTRKELERGEDPGNVEADAIVAPPVDDLMRIDARGVDLAERVKMPQLRSCLDAARDANGKFTTADPRTKEAIATWYGCLRELARAVTFADMNEKDIKSFGREARTFFAALVSDSRVRQTISNMSAEAISGTDHNGTGIIVIGTVTSVVPIGEYFRTDLKSADPAGVTISVLSRVDPRMKNAYDVSDEVLIAGVVLENPSRQLTGYAGSPGPIVFGGLPIRIER